MDRQRKRCSIVSLVVLGTASFLLLCLLASGIGDDASALEWEEEGFYGSSGAGGKSQVLVAGDRVYLFWVEQGFNNDSLWFQWHEDDAWTVPSFIAYTRAGPYEMGFDVDEDDGTVHLVWETRINEDRDIYYMTFDGTSWSSPLLLTVEKRVSNQTNPTVAVLGSQVHVAYHDDSATVRGIYHRHFDGRSWKPAERRSTDGPEDDRSAGPKLALWGKQVLLAWRSEVGVRLITFDGTTWSKVTTVVEEVFTSPFDEPTITAGSHGAFIAYQTRSGSYLVVNLTSNDGTGWSRAETVNSTPILQISHPCIAADAGYLCLAYTDVNERVTFSFHNGTGWSTAEVLNSTREDGQWYPHVILAHGTVHVTFSHRMGTYNLVRYLRADLEAEPPSSRVSRSGPYWTETPSVELGWSLADDYGIASISLEYRYGADNITWTDWTEFMFEDGESGTHARGTFSFEMADGDGHYQFRSIATDVWGNVEPTPAEPEAALGLDTTAPTGSISVEGGSDYTTTTTVTLTLAYGDASSGVAKVRFGNEAIGGDEPWEDPVETREWELMVGSGVKTVAFQVLDVVGMTSEVYMADIVLDEDAPHCDLVVDGGIHRVRARAITLAPSYGDETSPVVGIRLSNDGIWDSEQWTDPEEDLTWTLPEGDGEKTVYYQVRDAAGQLSQTYTLVVTLDTTAPYVVSTDPEDGEEDVQPNSSISLIFSEPMDEASVENAVRIRYSYGRKYEMMNGSDFEWSPDGKMVTFKGERPITADGSFKIEVWNASRDLAGNPLHSGVEFSFSTILLDVNGDNGDGDGDGDDGGGSLWGAVVALIIIVVMLAALVGYLMMRGGKGEV